MILNYSKDENNQDILSSEDGQHQVMMEWEKPYMEKCIDVLKPRGSVLEIGFGFGYSASHICNNPEVESYTVIECCPTVWERFEEWKKQYPKIDIHLVKGRWEDVMCTLGVFDSVFFDDYSYSMLERRRFENFLEQILRRHSKVGTKISCYSTVPSVVSETPFVDVKCEFMEIQKPVHCKYTKGDKMYIPLITVKKNISEKDCEHIKTIIKNSQKKIEEYYKNKNSINKKFFVIDNFYNNIDEVRKYFLSETFVNNISKKKYNDEKTKEYFESLLNIEIQNWDNPKNGLCYLRDVSTRFEISTSVDDAKWIGILFLDNNILRKSGVSFYRFTDGTNYPSECLIKNNQIMVENYNQDATPWQKTDTFCNIYNRMVIFDADTFYSLDNPYGKTKESCQMIQIFFFN